ncbi:MAG: hypothetical protein K5894_16455, partial [Lachnospiraceae bacterium]|nr:hypothetical protein [Lachnospiraceae bacterium]
MGKRKNRNRNYAQQSSAKNESVGAAKLSEEEKLLKEKSLAEVVPIEAPPTAPAVPKWLEDSEAEKKPEKVYISNDDQYYFGTGTHYDIYKKLGAHLSVENGVEGVYFSVWAPHARNVSLVGDFNE